MMQQVFANFANGQADFLCRFYINHITSRSDQVWLCRVQ